MKTKKFQLITKNDCNRCKKLVNWMNKRNIKYNEWKIEDRKIVDRLLADNKFMKKFDDPYSFDGVPLPTPAIRIEETGEYYSKELFGIIDLREDFIKKLLYI
ncbi:MAG: hypothetical protein ACTSWY_09885 [Promethearchaeota archaeon]